MTKIYYFLCLVVFFLVAQQPVLALEIITPIQVEIVESPAQKSIHLQNTYGTSNYYKCYESNHCGNVSSAPGAQSSCLSLIELCLIEMQRQEKVIEAITDGFSNSAVQCPAKTVNQNGICVCDKAKGYVSQNGGCYLPIAGIVPQKSNDQVCQDSYGSNSNWKGTKSSSGGLNCGCNNGYQYNKELNQCAVMENVIAPQSEPIKNAPTAVKPLSDNSSISNLVIVATTTRQATGSPERPLESVNATTDTNSQVSIKSVLKDIVRQGLLPWIFISISQWFQR